MAFISRLSSWFERVFDTSDGADVFEEEGAEGFLMTAVKEAPPVLPQLRTRPEEELIAEPPTFRPASARTAPQAEAAVAAAVSAPVLQDQDNELHNEAAEADELAAVEATLDTSIAAELPEVEDQASPDVVQSVPATDPVPAQAETGAVQPESVDMLSMFRSTTTATEFKGLTKDLEDVSGADLLIEAREVRDLLARGGSKTDNAA
jgi:hypothetical protein